MVKATGRLTPQWFTLRTAEATRMLPRGSWDAGARL